MQVAVLSGHCGLHLREVPARTLDDVQRTRTRPGLLPNLRRRMRRRQGRRGVARVPICTRRSRDGPASADAPVALFRTQVYRGGTNPFFGSQYDVASDGRFLVNVATEAADSAITLILNWTGAYRTTRLKSTPWSRSATLQRTALRNVSMLRPARAIRARSVPRATRS